MQLGDQHRRARPTAARGTGWLRPPGPLVAESWAIVVLPIMGIIGPTTGDPLPGGTCGWVRNARRTARPDAGAHRNNLIHSTPVMRRP